MSVVSPGCHFGFWPTGYELRFSCPLLEFDDLIEWLEWHTQLKKTLTYIYWFIIRAIIKDTDEQLDEEIYKARYGRALRRGASFCPCGIGMCHPPGSECIHQPGSSLKHTLLGYFGEAISCRHDPLLTLLFPVWIKGAGVKVPNF